MLRFSLLPLLLSLALPVPLAHAHIPLRLAPSATASLNSPIIIDGTISYAVYADFTRTETKNPKRPAVRHVRFVHRAGDSLQLQYLIPDTAQMRKMRKSQLPKVSITSPDGQVTVLVVNERTRFSKPYLPLDYFYLSRLSDDADAGTYTVTIRASRASSALVAIGYKEIDGDVLQFGEAKGLCPLNIEEQDAIDPAVANQLVGMSEEKAKLCAQSNGWALRIGERDGEFFALTKDYRIDRVTLSITAGIVREVIVG